MNNVTSNLGDVMLIKKQKSYLNINRQIQTSNLEITSKILILEAMVTA
jgi:hypothetical protein